MQLVLDSSGITLAKKGQLFIVFRDAEKIKTIAPGKLKSIAITAKVIIHSDAVVLAIRNQIPILFFNPIGKMKARLWSPYFESLATLRRQQVHFAESPDATAWMIDLFQLKTEAQIQHLKLLKQRLKGMQLGIGQTIQRIRKQAYGFENYRDALITESRQGLMGVEGTIARMYWQELGSSLPSAYRFKQRSRKPAKDIYNAGLNYLYGMLYSVVEGGLFAAGLDPQLGILHVDMYTKPTLSFDLIEPFRPWIDELLTKACLERKLKKTFFTKNQYGIFLNKTGKAFIIPLFNEFLRSECTFLNQTATIKNQIYFLAGMLAKKIRTTTTD